MRTILAAVAFLTRIPVPAATPTAPEASAASSPAGPAAFGLVGAGLGAVAALPLLALGDRVPWIAALLAVAILAIASGALHLDGLADTADALAAPDPERAERARKDPAVGAAGAVALLLALGLEVAALAQLASSPRAAVVVLVIAAAWGRAAAVVVAIAARGGARAAGLAAGFARDARGVDAVLAAAVPVALLAGPILLEGSLFACIAVALGMVVGLAAAWAVVHARHGLDGDGLGATVVLAETSVLVAAAIAASAVAPS